MAHRAGTQVSLLPPSSNPSAAASRASLPPLLRCVSSWAAYGGSLVQIVVLLGARKSAESGWRKAALSVIFGEDASSLEPVLLSERLQEADPAATRLTRLPPPLSWCRSRDRRQRPEFEERDQPYVARAWHPVPRRPRVAQR